MRYSLFIAKVSGIKIFIHWTFLILIFWIIGVSIRQGNNISQIIYSVTFVLTIFACVVLHELGHALTAKRFNYRTKDIILLPIGGMARMEELPDNPRQEFLIAIAGPMVNVVISALLYPFINWSIFNQDTLSNFQISGNNFLLSLFTVNLTLAIFNLIPAFPMDGGRILRALLAMRMDRIKATRVAAGIGQFFAIIFLILGMMFNPFLILISIFIFITAQAEKEDVATKFILKDYKAKDVATLNFYKLEQSASIMDAARLLLDVQATDFLVTDNDRVVGTLNRDDIIKVLTIKGENAKIGDAMNNSVRFISENSPLDEILKEFRVGKITIMPVMKDNELIGAVDINNIIELILIKTAIQKYTTIAQ